MKLYMINMYENYNTVNIKISFKNMYCLLHPSVVSHIIPYFMEKLFSYIHWKKLHMFKCSKCILSTVVWKCEWIPIFTFPHCLHNYGIYCDTHRYSFYRNSTIEAKCLWLNFHAKLCLQCFSIIIFCHNIIIVTQNILSY